MAPLKTDRAAQWTNWKITVEDIYKLTQVLISDPKRYDYIIYNYGLLNFI